MSLTHYLPTRGVVPMRQREQLARAALQKATEIRQRFKYPITSPICAYDLAAKLNIEVRFIDTPTMEGLYQKSPPVILISSLRPAGRQHFTCAHEIGHHVFGHGTQVDNLTPGEYYQEADEFLVNSFAGFLLMPKLAIISAFSVRGWKPQTCTSSQVFALAQWFSVGYETLIIHMESLKLITSAYAKTLKSVKPKTIREKFGINPNGDLFLLDDQWNDHALDVCVGDTIIVPFAVNETNDLLLTTTQSQQSHLVASRCGITRIADPQTGWSLFVRIARRNFVGRAIYRHLEDTDE